MVRPLTEVATDIEKTWRIQQQAKLQKQWIEGLRRKRLSVTLKHDA